MAHKSYERAAPDSNISRHNSIYEAIKQAKNAILYGVLAVKISEKDETQATTTITIKRRE